MSRSRRFEADAPSGGGAVWALALMVVAMLLMAAPRPLGPVPMPLLPVIAVYVLTVARPGLMPPLIAFGAGLVLDLLTGAPLGFWALGLLCVSGAARILRPFVLGADLWRRLAGMAAAVAAAAAAGLAALGAADRPIQPTWLQLVQLILTVLTYPVVEAGFSALTRGPGQRGLGRQARGRKGRGRS